MIVKCERIPRLADCLQWTGDNTDEVHGYLTENGMVSESSRSNEFILIRVDGFYSHTLRQSDWILKGEDKSIRFYTDEKHRIMYRLKSGDALNLIEFAREVLRENKPDVTLIAAKHGLIDLHNNGYIYKLNEVLR